MAIVYSPPSDKLTEQHRYRCQLTPDPKSVTHRRSTPSSSNIVEVIVNEGDFFFYLNASTVMAIHAAELAQQHLVIPSGLVGDLRRYALVDIDHRPQSAMTFYTHYADTSQTSSLSPAGALVLRSVVSLDGDVIHQITEECLEHLDCIEINNAHHWLINQLMNRLRLSVTRYVDFVFNNVPHVTMTVTIISNIGGLLSDPISALSWIVLSSLSYLLPQTKRYVIRFFWRNVFNPASRLSRLIKPLITRFIQ